MACFAVPVAEAIIVTAAAYIAKKKESTPEVLEYKTPEGAVEKVEKVTFSRKLSWLRNLLWGGSILLAFEHLWHGEIVPFFPFLTATSTPEGTAVMLHEMATVGVAMALLSTAVWCVMLAVVKIKESKFAGAKVVTE